MSFNRVDDKTIKKKKKTLFGEKEENSISDYKVSDVLKSKGINLEEIQMLVLSYFKRDSVLEFLKRIAQRGKSIVFITMKHI